MLKQKYFLTDFFILSAEKQPIKLSWRNIEWLPFIEQMKLGSRLEAAVPKDKIGDVKVMNNEYDNEKFFEEYAKMSRSKEGLKAAGEWHQLKPLFPSLEGKSVLDLGCGYGWHCKFAEEQGATKILGIDLRGVL